MPLPREYTGEDCAIARALEIIGERWTLLIVRDAFHGVARFSDFRDHLAIPRAVLTERLNLLVEHGIMSRVTAGSGRDEYVLTPKGQELWSTVWSLQSWGAKYYVPENRRRAYIHTGCGGAVALDGRCETCDAQPRPGDLTMLPRPTVSPVIAAKTDPVSRALSVPHRLLTPIERTHT
ncbi:MAG TPA: helix-turn-helix domain-containing protein [Streptosporangiaceae bacterium]|jgi:DNA-binding HxlR family transcriptional regulator|nr:helix-turn-helix domain-containing protein [Streptosporangiaceae bacterium]